MTKEKLIAQLEESHLKFSCSQLGEDMIHNCTATMTRDEVVRALSKMNEPLSRKVRDMRESNTEPTFCITCKDYKWCKRAIGATKNTLDFRNFMKQRKEES